MVSAEDVATGGLGASPTIVFEASRGRPGTTLFVAHSLVNIVGLLVPSLYRFGVGFSSAFFQHGDCLPIFEYEQY